MFDILWDFALDNVLLIVKNKQKMIDFGSRKKIMNAKLLQLSTFYYYPYIQLINASFYSVYQPLEPFDVYEITNITQQDLSWNSSYAQTFMSKPS